METSMEEKNPAQPNGKGVLPQSGKGPPDKAGTERDIMQLTEVMRDALCVHAIIDGLRGRYRSLIEDVLLRLSKIPAKAGTERDIMQFVEKSSELELPPEIYKALNHLRGNDSSYLGLLVRLALHKKNDWRMLPAPVKP